MTSKERVLHTLNFEGVDRLAKDIWILPAARIQHGGALEELVAAYDSDIAQMCAPFDHAYTPEYYQVGKYMDPWGSEWTNIQEGIIGEVKNPVFDEYEKMKGYISPKKQFIQEFDANRENLEKQIKVQRGRDKFVIGGWISLFERFQYLRGTEDLYCDIALEEDEMFDMFELTMDFMRTYVSKWLEMDIDAVAFGDDWGAQMALLISPASWEKLFKPLYKELIDLIKAAGKKVFFHSDGYIFDLYPQFIELGVDAINSQLWCMGVEKVAKDFAGKITFWGEISRQTTLPDGTEEEILAAGKKMKDLLFLNGGGLIGQGEINRDVPLENVRAFTQAWD
ncbi:MAG: uroporphyrinogen decarboxylase family protein [Sphaerochaeta sp.]|nr:uroporphyrinogen decarboxylase family protein [Sphaerochaeta sp.]